MTCLFQLRELVCYDTCTQNTFKVHVPADERDGYGSTLRSIGKCPSSPGSCCGHIIIIALLFHFADIALSSPRYWLFYYLRKRTSFFIRDVHLCVTWGLDL